MTIDEFFRLLEIVLWPALAFVAIFVVRPHLATLLSGAKVKLSIAGQSIETTLPELKQILEEQAGESLSAEHVAYLTSLQRDGAKRYPSGIEQSDERKFLRPLRNSGLILTVPRNAFLREAEAIEPSALGRLYLRAKAAGAKGGEPSAHAGGATR
jgi:hypothetical protein